MTGALSVPANLLLLGEYAVLERGGLGLAVAPDIRSRIQIAAAERLEIHGHFGGNRVLWTPGEPDTQPLFREIYNRCAELCSQGAPDLLPFSITIDSSDFYTSDGRKLGLGSSASVSAGLSAALLRIMEIPRNKIKQKSLKIALESHRALQDGEGSGYDIFASVHGSIGLFTGGDNPAWEPLRMQWLPELYIFSGPISIASGKAIEKYTHWKKLYPNKAEKFKERMNREILNFVQSGSWDEGRKYFLRCRNIGLELGDRIGVSAFITPPEYVSNGVFKASGAGNELGILFTDQSSVSGFRKIEIAGDGLRWN
jgi:phosphomevalonate kinase